MATCRARVAGYSQARETASAIGDILAAVKVVIVGCGRVGSTLANDLAREGHEVAIIDISRRAFDRLEQNFSGQGILGRGIDQEILEQAGGGKAGCFILVRSE